MPITQDRLISILNAAITSLEAFRRCQHQIYREARLAAHGQQSPQSALDNITLFCTEDYCFQGAYGAISTLIAVEQERNRRNYTINQSKAAAATAARRNRGIPPRPPSRVPIVPFRPSSTTESLTLAQKAAIDAAIAADEEDEIATTPMQPKVE